MEREVVRADGGATDRGEERLVEGVHRASAAGRAARGTPCAPAGWAGPRPCSVLPPELKTPRRPARMATFAVRSRSNASSSARAATVSGVRSFVAGSSSAIRLTWRRPLDRDRHGRDLDCGTMAVVSAPFHQPIDDEAASIRRTDYRVELHQTACLGQRVERAERGQQGFRARLRPGSPSSRGGGPGCSAIIGRRPPALHGRREMLPRRAPRRDHPTSRASRPQSASR